MAAECYIAVEEVTNFLNTRIGALGMQALIDRAASVQEFADYIAEGPGDQETNAILRFEFSELPRLLVPTLVGAWEMAREAGKPFRLASRPPADGERMDYARNQRASYTVEYDEAGVTMYVSHMPRFHADWYKPRVAVAA